MFRTDSGEVAHEEAEPKNAAKRFSIGKESQGAAKRRKRGPIFLHE